MTMIHLRLTDVTEGWHDTEGVDIEATNYAYAERLEVELRKEYPTADVRVEVNHHVYGSLSDTITGDTFEEEQEIRDALSVISDRLMSNSEAWIVLPKS